MRIIKYKENQQTKVGFADCFGNLLTSDKISKLNMAHLEKVHIMFDSHENFLGYLMKEGDKYGAISVHGETYADYIYESFRGVTPSGYGSVGDDVKQDIWEGRKNNTSSYDIYHRYELIFEDAIGSARLIEDNAKKGEKVLRYVQIPTANGYMIYDIFDKKMLNLVAKNAISYINSEKKQILLMKSKFISSKPRVSEYTNTLIDFDGNVIMEIVKPYYLHFTNQDELFESRFDGKSGLVKFTNGVFEEIIPMKYREFVQVFNNKVVAINTQNCVKIIHFEKKMKKGVEVWTNKLDSYKLGKDVENAFFLEDESEGILELKNGKKILFSLYMQGNDEKFQCEDIFYEGNGIFKCYQFNGGDIANITFIYNGQAVNANTRDNNGHVVKLMIDDEWQTFVFTPEGVKMDIDNTSTYYSVDWMDRKGLKKYFESDMQIDFMTIPKAESCNLLKIYYTGVVSSKNALYNLLKGTSHEYNYSPQMVWHNIYIEKQAYHAKFHTLRGDETFLQPFRNFVAGFNHYAIFEGRGSIYLVDKDMFVTEYKNAKAIVDEYYQLCIIKTEKAATIISNDGFENFFDVGRTVMLSSEKQKIYKSYKTGNYVVGDRYVDVNQLKYDAMMGIVDENIANLITI